MQTFGRTAQTRWRGGDPSNGQDPVVERAREATYPPPYPDGWYVIARSSELNHRPKFVQAVGHQWVAFRDDRGNARVVDAYCPHLGANLADGRVRDGCVECPFHGWRVRGDGRVAAHANGAEPQPRHRTRSWAVDELHGWIVVYHRHACSEPGPAPEPPYRLEHLPEIEDGQLRYRGQHDAGLVHMHLVEFAENSVDFQHFAAIHDRLRVPWTEIPIPGMSIHHEASWRRDEVQQHVSWFGDVAVLQFRGRPIQGSGARAEVRFDGPGGVIRFDFTLDAGRGRVVLYQSHTPVAPLTQRVRFQWFSERRVPRWVASFVAGNWVSQWRQDIGIWERKIYRDKPMLGREDGPIHQLRRWYAQFYPTTRDGAPAPANRPHQP